MIEPSDIERSELPETSAAYIADLEMENDELLEQVAQLQRDNDRLKDLPRKLLDCWL